MPSARFFAGFLAFVLLSGPALAQPQLPTPPAAPSTDPALSLEANAKFLAENAKKPGVITTRSGLQYKIIRSGFGRTPTRADTVEVYYTGRLINNAMFDGTTPGLPATFNLTSGPPVQGFLEALLQMREGDIWQIWIPARLGYGVRGSPGGKVGPNQVMSFEVRLLTTKPPPKRGEPGYVPQPGEEKQ